MKEFNYTFQIRSPFNERKTGRQEDRKTKGQREESEKETRIKTENGTESEKKIQT